MASYRRGGNLGRSRAPDVTGRFARTEVDDGRHRATAVGPLVRRRDRHETRRVARHGGGDTTDARLDLPVPVHVGVIEHGVAPTPHLPVGAHLALEEATAATDDSSMAQWIGEQVYVVDGSERALKITTEADLDVARTWLNLDSEK